MSVDQVKWDLLSRSMDATVQQFEEAHEREGGSGDFIHAAMTMADTWALIREIKTLGIVAPMTIPVIPTIKHMRSAEDALVCPVTPRPFESQITDDPHAVTCSHCLKIMNEDARS